MFKPFNLEAALAGAKVITRDGREVTSITHFPTVSHSCNVRGVVDGYIKAFTPMGSNIVDSQFDLFMAPTKVVRWVNLYRNTISINKHLTTKNRESIAVGIGTFDSYIDARMNGLGENYIGTVQVSWEE